MKKLFRLTVLSVCTILALNSCGDDKKETEHNHEEITYEGDNAEPQIGETIATEAAVDNKLTIDCTDQMQFTKNELKATSGTVTLTLNHIGKMEKSVMGHNLVILKPGTDIGNFSLQAADAKANEFIPESEKGNVIAHTKLLGGGDSDTIEFTIEKGTYDYICSFPGHSSIMKGKLVVE
jgi:azurin